MLSKHLTATCRPRTMGFLLSGGIHTGTPARAGHPFAPRRNGGFAMVDVIDVDPTPDLEPLPEFAV